MREAEAPWQLGHASRSTTGSSWMRSNGRRDTAERQSGHSPPGAPSSDSVRCLPSWKTVARNRFRLESLGLRCRSALAVLRLWLVERRRKLDSGPLHNVDDVQRPV